MSSLLFLMLYCSMINVRCVFKIFCSACLLSTCCLRLIIWIAFAIFFQTICISESSMHYWLLDCWSFAERWHCVDALWAKRLLHSISVKMIVCSAIFVLCSCSFRDTWFLCLRTKKIFFSRRKIRSQRTSRCVLCCSLSLDWRFDFLLTRAWCCSLSLLSRAKSIWKITCHSIYSFRRLLSCIETIKRNDSFRNWRIFVFRSKCCRCFRYENSHKLRSVDCICTICLYVRNVDSWNTASVCNLCRNIRTFDASIHRIIFFVSDDSSSLRCISSWWAMNILCQN